MINTEAFIAKTAIGCIRCAAKFLFKIESIHLINTCIRNSINELLTICII